MLSGATRGRGGPRLAQHLADRKGQNDFTRAGASRGLVSDGIADQVRELTDLVSHARSRRPLYHLHADPAGSWTEPQWDSYWSDIETEFGLNHAAYVEAVHVKSGREHRHRVYSLVRPDGTCLRMDHDYARREKLSRMAELRTGEALTRGRHNRSAVAALDAAGRSDAAAALRDAGLTDGIRPSAPSPEERHQVERTGVLTADIDAAVFTAWRASDNGVSFLAALNAVGLRLAQGKQVPVVLDHTGSPHPLARALSRAARAAGGDPVRAVDVRGRLTGIDLVRHAPSQQAAAQDRGHGDVHRADGHHRARAAGAGDEPAQHPAKPPARPPEDSFVETGTAAEIPPALAILETPAATTEVQDHGSPILDAVIQEAPIQDEATSLPMATTDSHAPIPAPPAAPRRRTPPSTTQETADMPARRPQPRRRPKPAQWTTRRGGYDALGDADQVAAQAAYSRWITDAPELAKRYALADYVDYVQEKRAAEPDVPPPQPSPAPEAPRPLPPLHRRPAALG